MRCVSATESPPDHLHVRFRSPANSKKARRQKTHSDSGKVAWSLMWLWLLVVYCLPFTAAQGSVWHYMGESASTKHEQTCGSWVSCAGMGLAKSRASAYRHKHAHTNRDTALSMFGGLGYSTVRRCGKLKIFSMFLVFGIAVVLVGLANFYSHGDDHGGKGNWPVHSLGNIHVRRGGIPNGGTGSYVRKDKWRIANGSVDIRKRSWDSCNTCMEGHGPLNSVCKGDGQTLHQVMSLTGKGNEGSCNLCQKCPNCEGCFVSATPFDDFQSFRKNSMLLFRMNDSMNVQYLAKVMLAPHLKKVSALENVVKRCGFDDILPRERKGPFFARMPPTGDFSVIAAATVIFSEMREGDWIKIPLYKQNFTESVNKTQIVRAALFDFLFGAGDSGENNALYNPKTGSIYLVDTLHHGLCNQCHLFSGSVFYPGNLRFYAEHMHESSQLGNYQLYVENGRLGKNYPRQLRECLEDISSSDLRSVVTKYGMPSEFDAKRIQERAQWMQEGFEVAIWKQFCKYYANSKQYKKFLGSLNADNRAETAQRLQNAFTELTRQHCDA